MWLTIIVAAAHAAAAQKTFTTGAWQGTLAAGSGVLKSLKPTCDTSFDFSPADYFHLRNGPNNYHTGDITIRWRANGQGDWHDLDTAAKRDIQPKALDVPGRASILRSNFDNVFPEASKSLSIDREWTAEGDDLVLRATISNKYSAEIEIGAFGFPIEFNSIFTNRTADETTAKCVLVDPYIGLDAGYLQVTRLTGTGPNLIVTPHGNHSRFEAWRFLTEDEDQPTAYQSQTFEGLYAWQTLTKAYFEREWNATKPWNEPTSKILKPGELVSFALLFSVANSIHDIEPAVASKDIPVAVGVPGYILPVDQYGQLFLDTKANVRDIAMIPEGSLELTEVPVKNAAWKGYRLQAAEGVHGRVRISITYDDGKTQTVFYFITKATEDIAGDMSRFLFNEQWFTDASDPFHRAPSVISYDHEAQKQVHQDERVWIAGTSDEGGAGAFEAAAMKTSVHPDADEVHKLEEMVNETVYGHLQDPATDGVKRSLFFYQPDLVPNYRYDPAINWTVWSAWNKSHIDQPFRAYNYVHVSALYWSLYRAERASPDVLTVRNASWYLTQAHRTVLRSQGEDVEYKDVGLMGETVWLYILQDLRAEGLNDQAASLEKAMKRRQDLWSTQSEPFGSEMAWDSTGQEGVYLWSKYFNDSATVTKTLKSVRGYMPTVAHWGFNGNARRYWDFVYAGKLKRMERMIHHYGSGLNALPLLDAFKYSPDPSSPAAIHDLRVGYGGNMGPLSNIQPDGFGAMAFHSWPDTMKWDGYSGDYGPNFLGNVAGSCTFLIDHPDFGFISFGGNVKMQGQMVEVEPKDMVKRRIYVAPLGLKVELDAGKIQSFVYDPSSRSLRLSLARADGAATTAIMKHEDTLSSGVKLKTSGLKQERGGSVVPLGSTVEFAVA